MSLLRESNRGPPTSLHNFMAGKMLESIIKDLITKHLGEKVIELRRVIRDLRLRS